VYCSKKIDFWFLCKTQ